MKQKRHGILAVFSVVPLAGRENGRKNPYNKFLIHDIPLFFCMLTALRLLYPKQKESATAGAALLGDYLPLRLELRFSPNARESEILLSLACMKCLSLSSKERSPVFCNVLRTGAGTACRGR